MTKLTPQEKSLKKTALANVARSVYFILWHAKIKFPGIEQKKKGQGMEAEIPSASQSRGLLKSIGKQINEGIRRLSTARRNTARTYSVSLYIYICVSQSTVVVL